MNKKKFEKLLKQELSLVGQPLEPAIEQLNSLVYWYPILQEIRIPTPKTIIVHSGLCKLGIMSDGKLPEGWKAFEKKLKQAMNEVGYPCFLRTGQMSNKHDWKESCFVSSPSEIKNHVTNLVEASYIANIAGSPFRFDFWVIRELLETEPVFNHFPGEMPVTREIRAFINKGKTQCVHPYWVTEAFKGLDKKEKELLKKVQKLPPKSHEVYKMIEYVSKYFKGYWSVDFLEDKNGKWWCIDMAVGKRSYHYPKCKYNKLTKKIGR